MKMNKLLTLLCAVTAVGLVGCQKPKTETHTLGLGYSANFAQSYGTYQADVTAAAVVFDKDNVVVNAYLDVAQVKVAPKVDGDNVGLELTGTAAEKVREDHCVKTKLELGELYGMKNASAIGKEVNDQINSFVAWTIGKSLTEIRGAAGSDGYATDAGLKATCSIKIVDFVNAYVDALGHTNEFTHDAGDVKVGLAMNAGLAYNYGKPSVEISTDLAASAVVDGKVAASLLDVVVVHPSLVEDTDPTTKEGLGTYSIKGLDTTSKYHKGGSIISKSKLGDGYAMASRNGGNATCTLEWFEQAWALEGATIGKTSEEIAAFKAKEGEIATVTITADGLVRALANAAKVAK